MKKILLTGAALILVIILAVEFYTNRHGADDKKYSLQATPNDNSAATSAALTSGINNEPRDLNDDMPPSRTVAGAYVVKHKHAKRHTIIPIDESMSVVAVAPESDGLVVIMNETPEDVTMEKPKEFFGNYPEPQENMWHTDQHIESRKHVHFGPEIGFMQNDIYRNNTPKMLQSGFYAGGIADIELNSYFSLQPGLKYAVKGFEVETITTTDPMIVDTKDRVKLQYIELPLDAVVKFGDWHNCRVMFGAGPYVSYLLKAQDKYETTTTNMNAAAKTTAVVSSGDVEHNANVTEGHYSVPVGNTGDANSGKSMRTLDWGVNGFAGVETPGGLFMKAGTEVGLMDIQHDPGGSYSTRNFNLFVSVGYLIGYKR